jgi:adenylate cyclase
VAKQGRSNLCAAAIGGLLVSAIGCACIGFSFGRPLARLSYDVPFILRGEIATPEVCLIYMDDNSARNLGQGAVWDRRLHAHLLQRLKSEGCKAVVFDVVFSTPSETRSVDEEFALAIQSHGQVFLGAALDLKPELGQAQEQVFAPAPQLRRAAAGWGLLAFRPIDPDYSVRHIYGGTEQTAAVTWLAAVASGASLSTDPAVRAESRWINYYSAAGSFDNVSYEQALGSTGLRDGFFKDRVVFIGGRSTVGPLDLGKDEFATPFTRFGKPFAPGLEIHATTFLNLLRGDWLTRLPMAQELALAGCLGLVAGASLALMRPQFAALGAIALAGLVTAGALWAAWDQRVWFSWIVPMGVQVPLALVWSIGANYFTETRRRRALRRAFSLYLSPQMADRISDSSFDLTPGGSIVEASIVFTDLKGFTALSETLGDPERLSRVLIAYFNNTTRGILESNGTIIKYIGDAVLAAWGAPIADADHACKAALAACEINKASRIEVLGHTLTTRIGVNCGRVLAGNLGSDFRFDYTVIGDPVNFASRLEGLNKYLGTEILISESIYEKVHERFQTRRLGRFIVVGKQESVAIHELIGTNETAENLAWRETFLAALEATERGAFDEARQAFEKVSALKGTADGPSEFYLRQMEMLNAAGNLAEWDGTIRLMEK